MSMYKHYSDGRRRFLKMSALFGTAALISPAIARAEGGVPILRKTAALPPPGAGRLARVPVPWKLLPLASESWE